MYKVGIAIYEAVNELEVLGVYDVLSSVRTMSDGRPTQNRAFSIELLAATRDKVLSAHDFPFEPTRTFAIGGIFDVVIVPGGPGARQRKYPEELKAWLSSAIPSAKYVLSLSTGAFILASCGFLKNRRVAVFPPFASDLKQIEPTARIVCHERVALDEAKWLSTSGMSCSVDAAAALVAKLEGSLAADLALRRISWPIPINDIISLYSS